MKKALIWKEDAHGRIASKIEMINDAESIDSWSHYMKEHMVSIDVPQELEDKQQEELEAVLVEGNYVLQLKEI
jgi:hypothetical protein